MILAESTPLPKHHEFEHQTNTFYSWVAFHAIMREAPRSNRGGAPFFFFWLKF